MRSQEKEKSINFQIDELFYYLFIVILMGAKGIGLTDGQKLLYIMNEDQLSMYSAYMSTLGNREALFPGSGSVDKYIENPPDAYTVNAAYLTDEKLATLIAEAEKYLGYPSVWGGSNPSTSFDCSGFVS